MKTILIVDNKASVQRLVVDYLTENSFRTVVANNGREAIYVEETDKFLEHYTCCLSPAAFATIESRHNARILIPMQEVIA